MWLRKFPRPVFIVATKDNEIISWVFIEEWEESAKDGSTAWVLRAIETVTHLRNNKIGYRLLLLGLKNCVGYMITKPLTPEAARFFKRTGFMEETEFRRAPVDLSRNPGYLTLPPYKKNKTIEDMNRFFSPHQMGDDEVKNIL